MTFSDWKQLFEGDFRANLDETVLTLMWFNLQRNGPGNGLSNNKDTFAENLLL